MAAGQNTSFNCTASGRIIIWIITIPGMNEHTLLSDDETFHGFTRIDPPHNGGTQENMSSILLAEGRLENNNTCVCCIAQIHSGSSNPCPEQPEQAHLIVIGEV